MPEDDDQEIKNLLRITSQSFEEQTKRIGQLLENAQEKFERDYTTFAAVLGTALLVAGAALAWFNKSEGFAIVLAIIGAVFFGIGLILRHLSADTQVKRTQALVELERERARYAQRFAVFQHLWLYGPPKDLTHDQIRFFLGDESPTPQSTALAAQNSKEHSSHQST